MFFAGEIFIFFVASLPRLYVYIMNDLNSKQKVF